MINTESYKTKELKSDISSKEEISKFSKKNKDIEISDTLSSNSDKLKTIEKDIIVNEKKQLLQNEISTIFSDNKITKEERESIENIKNNLTANEVQHYFDSFPELSELWIEESDFDDLAKLWYKQKDIIRIINKIKRYSDETIIKWESANKLKSTIKDILNQIKTYDIIENIIQEITNLIENISSQNILDQISYVYEQQKYLEKEKYEAFLKKLWEKILLQYLWEKQLEIYEITIDENWSIIIKTKWWKSIIISNNEIEWFSWKFIEKKLKELLWNDWYQKVKEKMKLNSNNLNKDAEKYNKENKKYIDNKKSINSNLLENLSKKNNKNTSNL